MNPPHEVIPNLTVPIKVGGVFPDFRWDNWYPSLAVFPEK